MEYWDNIKKFGRRATFAGGLLAGLIGGIYFGSTDVIDINPFKSEPRTCSVAKKKYRQASGADTADEFVSLALKAREREEVCYDKTNRFEFPDHLGDVDIEFVKESCRRAEDMYERAEEHVNNDNQKYNELFSQAQGLDNICRLRFPRSLYASMEDII
ncbi:MAG: hypothetical protein ABEK17_02705 [Candidatus Aenigmatarchaeota archaeon]